MDQLNNRLCDHARLNVAQQTYFKPKQRPRGNTNIQTNGNNCLNLRRQLMWRRTEHDLARKQFSEIFSHGGTQNKLRKIEFENNHDTAFAAAPIRSTPSLISPAGKYAKHTLT